jgi:hypothetical protein
LAELPLFFILPKGQKKGVDAVSIDEQKFARSDAPGHRMPPPWERNWSAETQTAEDDSLFMMADTVVRWTQWRGFGANELAKLLLKLDLFDSIPIRVEGKLSPDGRGTVTDVELPYMFGGCDTGDFNGGVLGSGVILRVKPDEAKPS